MDPITALIAALTGLGLPGVVIGGLGLAVGYLAKELIATKKELITTIKDLQQLRLDDLKQIIVTQENISREQVAALNRLADKINR
jgi:hypothetical protein